MTKQEKPIQKTLLVKSTDGEFKIELPIGARITFGPTIPCKPKAGMDYNNRGYSLRIYEGKSNDSLVAVFSDVQSFRDISIPVAKLVIREAGKSVWKSDEDGFKVEQEVKYDKSFEDLKLLTT